VSASAELYIAIDASDKSYLPKIEEKVEEAIKQLGYNPTDTEKYSVSRYTCGIVIEARGYSVDYDVFREDWAKKLVLDIDAIDNSSDVEVCVYNLDREADVQVSTRYLGLHKKKEVEV
jgi:hypothetical protein